mmetsp:Transcript_30942/g.29565  ORF Transcript_30942/g.29565 Transcript_30942/m.29565 type:complete len:151 (+) Transcript_30942:87-539(+)
MARTKQNARKSSNSQAGQKFATKPPDIKVTKKCTVCEKKIKQSDFSKLEWTKEADDDSRTCWRCSKGEALTKVCSKCEEVKDRCFFVKNEWRNQKSRCTDCMKVVNDARKEKLDEKYAGAKAAKVELKELNKEVDNVEVNVKKMKIKKPE